jgi:hypothetical protein
LWGNYNLETGTVTLTEPESPTGDDLYGRAAVLTAEHGGRVHVLAEQDLPELRYGAAVLRY